MMVIIVSSSSNEEASKFENLKGYCSKESCQEIRARVESLEKTVRTIVAALSSAIVMTQIQLLEGILYVSKYSLKFIT